LSALWVTRGAVILPWQIWTRLILQIPSDLLSQNFGHAHNVWELVYPRLFNLATLVFPLFLLPESWAGLSLRGNMPVSLVFAIGIIPLMFLPWALICIARELPLPAMWLGLVSGLILVVVFGELGARPLLHGWQAVAPLLLALTLLVLFRRFGPNAVLIAGCAQLPLNAGYLLAHAASIYQGA
jgi:hypothetical protein